MKTTVERVLLFGFLLSVIYVIFYYFLFIRFEECLVGAYELGQIFSNLALAYISSYIFHYVVVIQRERKDKRNINVIALKYLNTLLYHGWSVYWVAVTSKNDRNNFDRMTITKDEYKEFCSKTNIFSLYEGRIRTHMLPSNFQFIQNSTVREVRYYVGKLLILSPHLDTELIKMLLNLELSELTTRLGESDEWYSIQLNHFPNANLDGWSEAMYNQIILLRELQLYVDTANGSI
jgi:hypothetical protein